MGFGPQLVDLNGDGRHDVLSGDWPGQVILFQCQQNGTFAPGQPIKNREGKTIKVDYGASVFAADWDDDRDLDILMGTVDATGQGNVYLIRNDGSPTKFAFGKPVKLRADGKDIVTPDGDAAPVAADWDRDGRLDLIVGAGDGSVHLYLNFGSTEKPVLSASEILVPAPNADDERGLRAKICVTDWNEDGRLDLVLGDFGDEFDKALSKEEQQWRDNARRQQAELLKSWSAAFRLYRKTLKAPKPTEPEESRKHEAKLVLLRERMVQLKRVRDRYHHEEQSLNPGKQHHGRVWLLLGR